MSLILSFFEFIQASVWIWKQINLILKERDAEAAANHRAAFDKAMDQMELAKTPEEQREAIKNVAKNSF